MTDFTKKIEQITDDMFFRAQVSAYKTLLNDIELHDYTTISEIKGAIQSELDTIERLRAEEANEYEAAAKADHFSEGQFNHE